jgi:hypothetical protein
MRYAAQARAIASIILLILALCCIAQAQITFPFLTPPRFQAFDANGNPLAGGFLYTYAAGGSVPLATFHLDTLGNLTQNQNPIILDSLGSAEVRLQPAAYKMTLQDSNHAQIWSIDQIEDVGDILLTQAVLLNPISGALQSIAGPLAVTAISAGGAPALASTAQSGTGSLCLTVDCLLVTPTINGVPQFGGVTTGFVLQNYSVGGTFLNTLTKIANTGGVSAVAQAQTSDTSGIVGVTIASSGTTGNAVVVSSGETNLLFDGSTVGGDYVQNSTITAGYGHDAGASYPTSGQIIGRILNTVSSPGSVPVLIELFGPEIQAGSGTGKTLCANGTYVPVSGNTTSSQIINTCVIPAGILNSVGATFSLTGNFSILPGITVTSSFAFGWGTTASLGSYSNFIAQTSNPASVEGVTTITCVVEVAGSGGVVACVPMVTWDGALGGSPAPTVFQAPFQFGYNLTTALYVGTACAFNTASTSNTCGERVFTVRNN